VVSRLVCLCRAWSAMLGVVDSYATIAEVAREFRVSEEHVRRMCVDGRLSAVRMGIVWRIPRQELPSITKSRADRADAAGDAAGSNEDNYPLDAA